MPITELIDTQIQELHKLTETLGALEASIEQKRTGLIETLKEANLDTYKSEHGTASMGWRKTWTYSEAVKAATETLKVTKKSEETSGVAKAEEKPYLQMVFPRK